jgi:peroxiredoxin
MNKRIAVAALCASMCLSALAADQVGLGAKVPAFELHDLTGKSVSFAQQSAPVTVIAFISTKCPISNAFNDRMSAIYKEYSAKGVQFFFVNANANESTAEIVEHSKSAAFPFPVYKDARNQLADLFGAMSTPETYVIDSNRVLRYRGYIDDSTNPARARNHGLKNAIDALMSGKPVSAPETKAFGCTIKRVRSTT